MDKVKVQFTGTDGNVFALLGRCTAAMKRAGQSEAAQDLAKRVMQAKSYDEALAFMLDAVEAE